MIPLLCCSHSVSSFFPSVLWWMAHLFTWCHVSKFTVNYIWYGKEWRQSSSNFDLNNLISFHTADYMTTKLAYPLPHSYIVSILLYHRFIAKVYFYSLIRMVEKSLTVHKFVLSLWSCRSFSSIQVKRQNLEKTYIKLLIPNNKSFKNLSIAVHFWNSGSVLVLDHRIFKGSFKLVDCFFFPSRFIYF